MRIMVTGADGYIGKGVVSHLLDAGHKVIAMGLCSCGLKHDNLEEHVGDVFSYDFQSNENPDVLLHLAWRNGFSHNDISHLEDLSKHYLFIKAALEAGVKRIAVMGSMHEVGYHEGAVDENTPAIPLRPTVLRRTPFVSLLESFAASMVPRCSGSVGFISFLTTGAGVPSSRRSSRLRSRVRTSSHSRAVDANTISFLMKISADRSSPSSSRMR